MLLIDENLSYKLVEKLIQHFPGTQAVVNINDLGEGADDQLIWKYAKENNLLLVTKDKDFVNYWKHYGPPPKVVKLNIGNCRLNKVELLLKNNKMEIVSFIGRDDGLLVLDDE